MNNGLNLLINIPCAEYEHKLINIPCEMPRGKPPFCILSFSLSVTVDLRRVRIAQFIKNLFSGREKVKESLVLLQGLYNVSDCPFQSLDFCLRFRRF